MIIKENKRPVVLINQHHDEMKSNNVLRREVEGYGWRLFNLSATKGFLPRGMPIIGALLQHGSRHPIVKMLKGRGIPYVRVGCFPSFYYEKTNAPSVAIDHAKCGNLAATFFAERGFNHLAYIGSIPMVDGQELYETFKQSAKSMGCKTHLFQVDVGTSESTSEREDFLWQSGKRITDWLATLPKPVGLLTYSDNLAARYVAYCQNAGLDVPNDVAILGIGNSTFLCEAAGVTISSIDLPWSTMWIESLKLLNSLYKGKTVETKPHFIPPSYVSERESTEVLAIDDPIVKKGVQFIWENYSNDIGVDDLVKSMGVSRRTLQRTFQDCLGRGVNEEIRKKRLDVAKRLLVNTNKVIADIAKKCGYNTSSYFHKAFVKSFGCTPLEYRKKKKEMLNLE
jgi:LacI family transcriptional regulator